MTKRKKVIRIAAIAVLVLVLISVAFVMLINRSDIGKEIVYESAELRRYDYTRIRIRDGTGLFELSPQTGFDYEVLVTKPGFRGDVTLLRKKFHYNYDKPLCKEEVEVNRFDDHVVIKIHCGEEIEPMCFVCYY